MQVRYENKIAKPEVIEQCNFAGLDMVSFFLWFTEFDMGGGVSSTVCIWRIKYKN